MRVLFVGAGAIGGYFGGRLLEAGRDVTFLVRPRRAAQLAEHGLTIKSPCGDFAVERPRTILAEKLAAPYDLVILCCKAYDLEGAIDSFAPAMGPASAVLPLLNGMRHMDLLEQKFGAGRVLAGQCSIPVTLDQDGVVRHLSSLHDFGFGEATGPRTDRIAAIEALMDGVRFNVRASDTARHDMWEKWMFLATLAGMTCLVHGSIGDIVAAGGKGLVELMLEECRSIGAANGFEQRPPAFSRAYALLTQSGSSLAASMMRDLERGGPIEADHIIGDLLRRQPAHGAEPLLLKAAYLRLMVYEGQRAMHAG